MKDGPLFWVKWFRVILDEASYIKNPSTGALSFRACKSALPEDWRLVARLRSASG